jgi:hypothetical protein
MTQNDQNPDYCFHMYVVTMLYRQEPTAQFFKPCMFVDVLAIEKGVCHNTAKFFSFPTFIENIFIMCRE